jgi:hypothetical protein
MAGVAGSAQLLDVDQFVVGAKQVTCLNAMAVEVRVNLRRSSSRRRLSAFAASWL